MTTQTSTSQVFRSRFEREQAMTLARQEYERFTELLASLSGEEWSRPTACPAWNVRDMAGHSLGMAQMSASVPEMIRQQVSATRAAKKSGKPLIDELTDLQMRKNAGLTTTELVREFGKVGPRAVAGRRRTPGFIRSRQMTDTGPDGSSPEVWEMGFLTDTILTRDPWMHRSDIAEAIGRPMRVTPDHDGVLVADVVAEWATRHGQPFELTLTGPAGGIWSAGQGGESIEMDAVEFCRVLSGRGTGDGLLKQFVPF